MLLPFDNADPINSPWVLFGFMSLVGVSYILLLLLRLAARKK
jgi:hypothetical protein